MNMQKLRASLLTLALVSGGGMAGGVAPALAAEPGRQPAATASDVAAVRSAFDAWAAGTGGPFQLLREDARWTIVGRSAAAGTYANREAFMRQVIAPFNARLREPLKPTVRGLYHDGDMVIVLFDARAVALDGMPYENTYTWYLKMRDGRIAQSIAFFDSIAFDEFWTRVKPATQP